MMMKECKTRIINGAAIPNMPWSDRPQGCSDVIWRYEANPVIGRHPIPGIDRVYNSAVVPFDGKFAGVFRCDDNAMWLNLHAGFSDDGINWKLDHDRIGFDQSERGPDAGDWVLGYDPRVVWIEDRYYISWCNAYSGCPTIGLGWTRDFKEFHQMENSFLPFNRNGVLFPRKINGKYVMLSRPSDNGHTPFGDIYLSQSPDLVHWGYHRLVMKPSGIWGSMKIGAGPIPIETSEGWLLIYHGVVNTCNGYVYSFGAALLDLEQPWKVLKRPVPFLLAPEKDYECTGFVPNVTFPCSALLDADTGRLAIYYGAADTYTALAFTHIDLLMDFIRNN